MKYRIIKKDPSKQPKVGVYGDWKVQISEECYKQCVYCTINEMSWGGIDHYHIDHYRPKSIFTHLENDICNLFYACPVCNRFKSDDWPNEPNLELPSYPDPSITDYRLIFEYDITSYQLKGINASAKYLIIRLYLNRAQLVYERREEYLNEKEAALSNWLIEKIETVEIGKDAELIKAVLNSVVTIKNHIIQRKAVRPYKLAEIRKK